MLQSSGYIGKYYPGLIIYAPLLMDENYAPLLMDENYDFAYYWPPTTLFYNSDQSIFWT